MIAEERDRGWADEPDSGSIYQVSDLLQHRRRLAVVAVFSVAGFVAIIAGWFGVSGTRVVSDQLSYLASGTAVGLALIGVAGAVLMSDHQSEQRRQLRDLTNLLEELRNREPMPPALNGSRDSLILGASEHGDGNDHLLVVPGAERVHQPGCQMVRGKPNVRVLSAADAITEGLHACRVCSPDLVPSLERVTDGHGMTAGN